MYTYTEKENMLVIKDEKGKTKEFYKLFSFDSEEGPSYMVYTDSLDPKNERIYANIYDPTGNDLKLYPINTEYEWQIITSLYNELKEKIKNVAKEVVDENEEGN